MSNTLAMPKTTELAPVTPMDLIQRAAQSGASIEQMQQLFELKLRVEADEARKAFSTAMAQFKRTPPQINKNKHVKFGQTEYDHATLDHVVDAITPALSAVGIRHRWETSQLEAGWVSVTCILSHELGHTEGTTLKAQVDSSGSKNAIQAIGSSVTYLQRYTLLAATGMAAVGTDSDGGAPKGPVMPEPEVLENLEYIKAASCEADLKKFYTGACEKAQKIGDKAAVAEFVKAKNARYREIANESH